MEKVIIIGSGPAGYAAAVYTARAQLSPLLIAGPALGGQVAISSEIGNYLALIIGIGGGIGTFLGGYFADMFGRHDIRWYLWLPAAVIVAVLPFTFGIFLSFTWSASLLYSIIPAMAGTIYLGPSLAMVQALVPLRMRTVASAILLFIINMIGLGAGPQMVGVLSDLLSERFGPDGLRYALMIVGAANLLAAIFYVLAARHLKDDLPGYEPQ